MNSFSVFLSISVPSKSVKISEVQVRQKGLGYASSVGLEFKIAKDFAKNLYDANKEIYPPLPCLVFIIMKIKIPKIPIPAGQ